MGKVRARVVAMLLWMVMNLAPEPEPQREMVRVEVMVPEPVVEPPVAEPEPVVDPTDLAAMARKAVVIVEALPVRTGTRHAGLVKNLRATRLLKSAFPGVPTRKIKKAIEDALDEGEQ